MTLIISSLFSPAGEPSVMAMIKTGFWRALARAGPMTSGWRIFCQREVPRGVRPMQVSVCTFMSMGRQSEGRSRRKRSRNRCSSGREMESERGSVGGEAGLTGKLDLLDELQCLRFRGNVVPFNFIVHESDLDAILVKQGCGVGDTRHDPKDTCSQPIIFDRMVCGRSLGYVCDCNGGCSCGSIVVVVVVHSQFKIINPLSTLFKRHTSRIVNVQNDIKQCDFHQIAGQFHGEFPFGCDLVECPGTGYFGSDHIERTGWVECLDFLLHR